MFTDNCSKPLSGGASAGQTRHPRDYAFSIPFIATSRYPAATRLHLYLSVSSFLSFPSYSISGSFLSSPIGFPDAKVDCRT